MHSGAPSVYGTAYSREDHGISKSANPTVSATFSSACPADSAMYSIPNARAVYSVPKMLAACSTHYFNPALHSLAQYANHGKATEHDENRESLLSSIPSFGSNFRHALPGRVCENGIHQVCTEGMAATQTRGLSGRPPGN